VSDVFDYSPIIETASVLIGEFGQAAVLQSVATQTVDPVDGSVVVDTFTETSVNAVQTKHNKRYTPGAVIKTGDRFWYLNVIAGLGDQLRIGSMSYKIVKVWPVKPGDDSIVSRIQTRGGVVVLIPDKALYFTDMTPIMNVGGDIVETVD